MVNEALPGEIAQSKNKVNPENKTMDLGSKVEATGSGHKD